jgi:hypothetical protein
MKKLLLAVALVALWAGSARAEVYRISNEIWNIPAAKIGALTVTTGLFADGTATAPSIAFTSAPTTGFYYIPGYIAWAQSGAIKGALTGSFINLYSNGAGLRFGASVDAWLTRVDADHLGMYRTTNPQKFSVYGTYTDASNYERGYLSAGTTGLVVGHEAAGTGTARPVRIASGGTTAALFSQKAQSLTDEASASVLNVTVPTDGVCVATFMYSLTATDGTDIQGHTGYVSLIAYEDPDAVDTYVCSITEEATLEHSTVTAGTLTDAWACTNAATTTADVTPNSSLNVASTLKLNVLNNSGCVLAIP